MKCTIRKLKKEDIENGFLETLAVLAPVPDYEVAQALFKILEEDPRERIFVAVNSQKKIVGTITLSISQRFFHSGKVALIEDFAVAKKCQDQGNGIALMRRAIAEARVEKCYKIILACKQSLVDFYKIFGFIESGVFMRLDL